MDQIDLNNITVVVPVYNTGEIINKLVQQLLRLSSSSVFPITEIILIDDASHTTTRHILDQIANASDKISVYHLPKNLGQQKAVFEGIVKAKGNIICTIDDDMEYLPEELIKLYSKLCQKDADIVYGVRDIKSLLWWRKIPHILFYLFARTKGYPRVSSMRCFQSAIIKDIDIDAFCSNRYSMLDQYIIDIAKEIITIPITLLPRSTTRQKLPQLILHFLHFLFSHNYVAKVSFRK